MECHWHIQYRWQPHLGQEWDLERTCLAGSDIATPPTFYNGEGLRKPANPVQPQPFKLFKNKCLTCFLRGHNCLRRIWCVVENVTLANLLSKAVILLCLHNKRNIAFQIRRNVDIHCERAVMCADLLCYLKHAATPVLSLSLSLYSSHHDLIQSMSSVVVTMALNFMKWPFSFLGRMSLSLTLRHIWV